MLDAKCREMLIDAHKRFQVTKDRTLIDDAINLVMALSPESFFDGPRDKALEQRVFVHAPRSAHWTGMARTYKNAYGLSSVGGVNDAV